MNPDSRNRAPWYCLAIVGLVVAVFHGSLGNDFVNWDDPMFIYENPRIQSLDWAHLKTLFTTTEAGVYTPLSQLSVALDFALWGSNPAGFHLTALILHASNALLVFFVARTLIRRSLHLVNEDRADNGALAAALLFALHPMRVESVAWACERRDVLSGFFGLAAAWAYLRHVGQMEDSPTPRFPWYVATFVLFVCAVTSKAVVVGLPVIFLLLNIHPFGRLGLPPRRSMLRVGVEIAPLLLVSLATGGAAFEAVLRHGLVLDADRVGLEPRIAQSLVANSIYVQKLLLFLPLNPLDKFYHGYDFGQRIAWGGLAVSGTITACLLLMARRYPSGLIAWISYLLVVGPFLGVAQSGLQLTADRYTYLASVPLCIWLGGIFQRLWNKGRESGEPRPPPWIRPILAVAGVLIVGMLGVRTVRQVAVWRNSETLWNYSLQLDRNNMVAWSNLGEALTGRKEYARAIACYQNAVEITPRFTDAWFNMGNAYFNLEQYLEAAKAYRKVTLIEPGNRGAWHSMGAASYKLNDIPRALECYKMAMKLEPSVETEYNIGRCHEAQGDTRAALACYQSVARKGMPDGWIQWSELVLKGGKPREAIEVLREGMKNSQDLRIYLAYAGQTLAQRDARAEDLEMIQMVLTDADKRLDGKSRKVREMLEQVRKRTTRP